MSQREPSLLTPESTPAQQAAEAQQVNGLMQTAQDAAVDTTRSEKPAETQKKPAVRAEDPGFAKDGQSKALLARSGITHRQARALDILISEVARYTNGETTVQDLPIISEVGHLRQTMDEDSGSYDPKHRPHNISLTEMISIIKGMDDPRYIVLQDNGRYVEVVRYRGETRGRTSWAVLDFNQDVNTPHMNGYPKGNYNVLVTPFEPDDLDSYMKTHVEAVIYDKAKGSPERGSNRLWSSRASATPFAEQTVSQDSAKIKGKNSMSDRNALEQVRQRDADYLAAVGRGTAGPVQGAERIPALYDLALAMYAGEADRLYRQLSDLQSGRSGEPERDPAQPVQRNADRADVAGPSDGRAEPEAMPDPEIMPELEATPGPAPELPVDYLSILDLGYGPMSASRLRELIELGKVEQYVEDGRLRFRRVQKQGLGIRD